MDIVSSCGLPVASVVWQSAEGAWALTAVCKATFRLTPGVMMVAQTQEPPNEDDNYWNDDESRSLLAASDLAPFKPRVDVLVVGHAFAPRGTKVRSLTVRVCVGAVDKAVEVWCDRSFELDGRVREGAPFLKMPLRYERAAGGPDTSNPVGMSFDGAPDAYGRVPIANLQPIGQFLSFRGDTFAPVGLGPLSPHWPERATKLHRRVPAGWHRDWNSHPLPEGFDPAYFNAAPQDQQTDLLHPDERIVLENLHPEHARIVTRLPGIQPQAVVERATGHRGLMELVADTLCIDTDRGVCTLVWRGRIGLTHPREQGRILFTCAGLTEEAFEAGPPQSVGLPVPVALSGPERLGSAASEAEEASMTLAPGLAPAGRAPLPFETSPWVHSQMAKATPEPKVQMPEDAGATMFLMSGGDAALALPFLSPASPAGVVTLQFAPPAALVEPPAPPPFEPPPVIPSHEVRPLLALGVGAPLAAPSVRAEIGAADTHQAALTVEPQAPPMIGPLATSKMGTSFKVAQSEAAQNVVVDPSPAVPEPSREPQIEEYPIERCARIAARLACNTGREAEFLGAEDLDASGWRAVHEHWLAAIRARVDRRDKKLLLEYDRAYVSELEVQRGSIALEDYARFAEAAERGAQGEALAARKLPGAAWPNIHRVWIERMIKDPALGGLVRREMARQRAIA